MPATVHRRPAHPRPVTPGRPGGPKRSPMGHPERTLVAPTRPGRKPGRPGRDSAVRHLRVVSARELTPRARRRRAMALLIGLVMLVSAGLFAVVVAHVVLTQNQFRLDRLRQQVATETAKNERLRLEVAQAQSPARIVQMAEQRLGMVVPSTITYLEPVSPGTVPPAPPPTTPASPRSTVPAGAHTGASSTNSSTARPTTVTPTTAPSHPASHPPVNAGTTSR